MQLDGVVTKYQWLNPHVYIELDVQDEKGETKNWLIEGANPGILNRVGWTWNMIKPGDQITGFAFTQYDGTVYWDKIGISGVSDPASDPQRSRAAG